MGRRRNPGGARSGPRAAVLVLALLVPLTAVTAPAAAHHAPPPDDLWRPDPAAVPDHTTYVYLESSPGDGVGMGRTYAYDPTDTIIEVERRNEGIEVDITSAEWWNGRFVGPSDQERLQEGYYHDLTRYPFHDETVGGLAWGGEGRACGGHTGWFVVDEISYDASGQVATLRLRFEQRCDHSPDSPLNGEIVFDAATAEPDPDNPRPVPDGLWEPDPDALPDATTFVHLESEPGEELGAGDTYSYTTERATIELTSPIPQRVHVHVHGDERWWGEFAGPSVDESLEPGFYDELYYAGSHHPMKGGLHWYGRGEKCLPVYGWFVIDEIGWSEDWELQRLRLRFEQHCDGLDEPAIHGLIVYNASVPPPPSPNPRPIPDGLWQPDPDALPDAASYIHLESQPGDYIGQGATYTYDPGNAVVWAEASGARVSAGVNGDEHWSGQFAGPDDHDRLEVGYYEELQRYPFHNPQLGGLDWSGEGNGCGWLYGWFVVDEIEHDAEGLLRLRLRFQQHCEERDAPPLNGLVVWSRTAAPPPPDDPDEPDDDAGGEDGPEPDVTEPGDDTGSGDGTEPDVTAPGDTSGPEDTERNDGRETSGADEDASGEASSDASGIDVRIVGGRAAVADTVADEVAVTTGVEPRRIGGADRYATAVAVSADSWPDGSATVYLATGTDFPDALVGATAAGRRDAPVLLTASDHLPDAVAAELRRLAPTTVRVLGGTQAISHEVVAAVEAATDATARRIAGADRYATAAAVIADAWPRTVDTVYVATGADFPDALAGAAAAGRLGIPVLLTAPDMLPAATAAELRRLGPSDIVVLGGAAAVSDEVVAAITEVAGVAPRRIAGADRYATAAATVADVWGPGTTDLYLASGEGAADALAGAAAAVRHDAPLLLTRTEQLPRPTADEVRRLLS